MPEQPFQYEFDAFISYSSKDRLWAKRLAEDLKARKLRIFYDETSLRVGEDWQNQLQASLHLSKHLIVLWSGSASEKGWVTHERAFFYGIASSSSSAQNSPERKELLIMLEEPPPEVLPNLQQIRELLEAGAYAKGVEQLDVNVWTKVVKEITTTIRRQSDELPILVAVLATTKEFLSKLDFDEHIDFIGSMNEVIATMGIKSKEELLTYYGASRDDWRPFGNNADIWTVLDKLKLLVANATDSKMRIAFELIGADLWSTKSIDIAKNEAYRLGRGLSLVIIDPISLVDKRVQFVLDMIDDCFSNTKSAIMVLTPYRMHESNVSRKIIESLAMPFWSKFYEPPVPPVSPFANFGINIGDEVDMNRLMLLALGQHRDQERVKSDFL